MTTLTRVALALAVIAGARVAPSGGYQASPLYSAGPRAQQAAASSGGIWISRADLARRPADGPAWNNVASEASGSCGAPNLADQDSATNVCVMAKALVYGRTGEPSLRRDVAVSLRTIVGAGKYEGRALALGRELAAYVIAADLIDLRAFDPALDAAFRARIAALLVTSARGGPASLVECHERRPNNWGTHCGASRAAVAAYLGDAEQLAHVARIFRGWLGDRSSYAGFRYGDLSWQCDATQPVGINRLGCTRDGHSIDGVLPDDQRRGGSFAWPPPKEEYVYGGLSGALIQAVILQRAGYPAFEWQDRALLRAFGWLHTEAGFPAEGDDTWQPHVVNFYYGTRFPAPIPARPGKGVGWTDWTHGRRQAMPSSATLAPMQTFPYKTLSTRSPWSRLVSFPSTDTNQPVVKASLHSTGDLHHGADSHASDLRAQRLRATEVFTVRASSRSSRRACLGARASAPGSWSRRSS